jgi:hypothetical protein
MEIVVLRSKQERLDPGAAECNHVRFFGKWQTEKDTLNHTAAAKLIAYTMTPHVCQHTCSPLLKRRYLPMDAASSSHCPIKRPVLTALQQWLEDCSRIGLITSLFP